MEDGGDVVRVTEPAHGHEARQEGIDIVMVRFSASEFSRERAERFGLDGVLGLFVGEPGATDERGPAVVLGFGGDRKAGRSLVLETSAAVLLDPHWAVGVEYRQKPDNLGFAREDDWRDVFVAWFPNKHVAVVAAYADLGSIATLDKQRGPYLSLQASF